MQLPPEVDYFPITANLKVFYSSPTRATAVQNILFISYNIIHLHSFFSFPTLYSSLSYTHIHALCIN